MHTHTAFAARYGIPAFSSLVTTNERYRLFFGVGSQSKYECKLICRIGVFSKCEYGGSYESYMSINCGACIDLTNTFLWCWPSVNFPLDTFKIFIFFNIGQYIRAVCMDRFFFVYND